MLIGTTGRRFVCFGHSLLDVVTLVDRALAAGVVMAHVGNGRVLQGVVG